MEIEEDQHVGRVAKVLSVDEETAAVHARYEDGSTTRFNIIQGDLPSVGQIILHGTQRWEPAPETLWKVANAVGTVRRVVDDGSLLVDDGIGIRSVKNPASVEAKVHNTVEYNDIDGLVRVVAPTPIRSRDYGLDRNDILKEYLVKPSADGPTFKDFGGYPGVIERARELIETQLNRRDLLEKIGARPVKGVLLTGPPGTGKTYLARIIAQVSGADFFLVSGPSIVSKWVGDTEDTLRKIFEAAATCEQGRAIIFFDEIDSIAERRTGETHEASNRLVAQLLTLLDGFSTTSGNIVIIGATNRIQTLDPALTRPGRFDWEIVFNLPDVFDRQKILQVHARGLNTAEWLPLEDIAALTPGWSAAELDALWAESALLAAGEGRDAIAAEDLALAYERVAGRPRRTNEGQAA